MNDVERALSEISDIRSRMAASTRFRGYAPEAVAISGLLSFVVMLAMMIWPERFAASDIQQALLWGAVMLAGSLTIFGEVIGRTRRQHGGMAEAMLRGAMRTVLPISLVCLVPALVVILHAPQVAWLLPGLWQMLIGVAAFASYSSMPRGIVWPASWYLLTGAAVTLVSASDNALSPLLCGIPFIVGHIWIAWLLHRQGPQYS
ncbi:MAG: hypothetical protein KDE55_01195 [Novosphingobium sp.]|nr:hypothetical protein [Novosphingobium sp.]